jgi:hypothetical protein
MLTHCAAGYDRISNADVLQTVVYWGQSMPLQKAGGTTHEEAAPANATKTTRTSDRMKRRMCSFPFCEAKERAKRGAKVQNERKEKMNSAFHLKRKQRFVPSAPHGTVAIGVCA